MNLWDIHMLSRFFVAKQIGYTVLQVKHFFLKQLLRLIRQSAVHAILRLWEEILYFISEYSRHQEPILAKNSAASDSWRDLKGCQWHLKGLKGLAVTAEENLRLPETAEVNYRAASDSWREFEAASDSYTVKWNYRAASDSWREYKAANVRWRKFKAASDSWREFKAARDS